MEAKMLQPDVLRNRAAECRRITDAARRELEQEATDCLQRAEQLDRDRRDAPDRQGREDDNPLGPDGRPINPQKTATPGSGQF